MKSSLAHKFAEEFINALKYNPGLKHDEKILALELRLDKLISDVEKACEEAHKRTVEARQSEKPRNHLYLDPGVEWGEIIVAETPNEQEKVFGAMIKSRGPAN
jgi:hypothetical protein